MVGTETVQPMYPVYLYLPFVYLCMPAGLLGLYQQQGYGKTQGGMFVR